jgi:putative endonuclease
LKISKEIGNKAEDKATEYLEQLGYLIVERNFYSHYGEIDIIALKEETFHFIEVKYSKNSLPYERITPSKLQKILKTMEYFLYKNNVQKEYQVDAIFLNDSEIKMVENITFFG